ncbi:hypothetical protein BMS3Bbin14_01327 [bacterium BMS3Bbin14]|nr:hypothetical protein BMS3Abin13_01765 [bacterium BMS3Abin13]GBE52852.1 hypothetical protein BMS3Bbin14_01327 [bacterium BMS3Bbin14]
MKAVTYSLHRRFVGLVDFISFCYRLLCSVRTGCANSRVGLHFIGKARRLLLVHYRKDYVRRQLSERQGACRQCGICCNLLFTCPMLTNEGRCLAYGTCRPQACKVFPVDQRDVEEVRLAGGQCGYCFKEQEQEQEQRQELGGG